MSRGSECRQRTRKRAKIDPRVAEIYCRERDITYASPLRVSARLVMRETGEIKETGPDGIFLGDFPMMTTDGTFMINGAERVVVSQLVRSPGVYFERDAGSGDRQAAVDREADSEPRRLARVRDLQPRRHFGQSRPQAQDAGHDPAAGDRLRDDDELRAAFADVDTNEDRQYMQTTHGEGADQDQGRGADRALPPVAPGRSADPRQRDLAAWRTSSSTSAATTSRESAATSSTSACTRDESRPKTEITDRILTDRRPGRDHPRDDPTEQWHR